MIEGDLNSKNIIGVINLNGPIFNNNTNEAQNQMTDIQGKDNIFIQGHNF